jgi:hypothetical protein
MKKIIVIIGLVLLPMLHAEKANAQIPILEIIKAAIVKVIKAIDLQIQRQQNKVIWLQNAQKELENTMSKLKLDEITGWVDKQKKLYDGYYQELKKVKDAISYYQRIKAIISRQQQLVSEYKNAWNLLKQDKHFTPDEITYMGQVYTGIINESVKNLDQIMLVINSLSTEMTDAARLEIFSKAAKSIEANVSDLHRFSTQNELLSLNRAKDANDAATIKKLYGLPN